jgi:polyphosphate kinase 2 (PPK2 family)
LSSGKIFRSSRLPGSTGYNPSQPMLANLPPSPRLSKTAYRHIRRRFRRRLFELEEAAFEKGLPSIILFEGWDASGKGASIAEITRRLDPRGFKVYYTQPPRTHESKMPWLWRFWMQIPRRGQMAIFDHSYYRRVTIDRVEQNIPIPEWIRAYEEINTFERTLAADGVLFVKFFLHLTEARQLQRFIEYSSDPVTQWQITAEDWARHQQYASILAAYEDMLENTNTPYAPWTVIPAHKNHYRLYAIYTTLINALETALDEPLSQWETLEQLEAAAQLAAANPDHESPDEPREG